MRYVRFLPKAITVYFREEEKFDCKNNHKSSKLANFWIDNISQIYCKMLVVFLYTKLRLGSKKIQLILRLFKSSATLL